MSEDEPEDEISRTIAYGSEYERLRLRGGVFTGQSLERKVRLHAALLFAIAAVYPIALVVPPAVRPLFPGPSLAGGSPNIVFLGLSGIIAEVFGGVLTWVVARRTAGRDIAEAKAQQYVALESVATVLGFGTGGIAVGLTVGFFAVNLFGIEAATALQGALAGARGPYDPSGIGVSVRGLAALAFALGLALYAASYATGTRPSD